MKQVKIIFIITFFAVLLIPMILFNHEKNAVSHIDNKVLTENPLGADAKPVDDMADALEAFVSERIGLRDEMIYGYTVANDRLFGEMVHPTYMYGKDGHVFLKAKANKVYGAFEDAFVHMLCEIQKYCDDRDIAFVFVYEPSKIDVLRDKLPDGYIYSDDWVHTFFDKLDENGVNYVDNAARMKQCRQDGIQVFNVKYDAGHWNATGAFYGMNHALVSLKEQNPLVHVNDKEEFIIGEELNTTLSDSKFPIHEYVPVFDLADADKIVTITDAYAGEIEIDPKFRNFIYCINQKRLEEGGLRALVFQGSYINGKGYQFLQNSFGEYIGVHAYSNVTNFDYYVNIFQPDCIIMDAVEWTFSNQYFDRQSMNDFYLNPLLSSFDDYKMAETGGRLEVEHGAVLTQLKVYDAVDSDYAYAVIDGTEFDMEKCIDEESDGIYYKLTITTDNYNAEKLSFIYIDTQNRTKYVSD